MAAQTLRYHGLVTGHTDGGQPRLQVVTPAGVLREVPLERRDLLRLIQRAAAAIEYLDRTEAGQ